MFVSPAYAQDAGGGLGGLGPLLPLILIFVVFYFLLIRPQQKKQKAHREMLSSLRRGDRIVTNGGLIGRITKVANDTELIVEIAEGIKVRVMRSMVADLVSKPSPARQKAEREEEPEDEYEDEEVEYEDEEEHEEEAEKTPPRGGARSDSPGTQSSGRQDRSDGPREAAGE